jgi:flavin prenyltransferase
MSKQHIIIGITGASGFIYGLTLLRLLQKSPLTTHLVITDTVKQTAQEADFAYGDLSALADHTYNNAAVGARIASGSFKTMGMIIAPCSMKTLAGIANGFSSNLLLRAADVVLKERRRLVLMTRETPLHAIHLSNMQKVTQCGGIIYPATPAFYNKPATLDEMVHYCVGRALDLFGVDLPGMSRWLDKK